MHSAISCTVKDLGLISYQEAYRLQKEKLTQITEELTCEFFLCEHFSVITLGRLSKQENILFSEDEIKSKGIEIQKVDRGGDVTYHAPGQLIVYPIFPLLHFGKDLKKFISNLEQVVIDLLGYFGILASRKEGRTGVWVGLKKIASIGIGVKKWISFHGVGLNVSTDLKDFLLIRPCGLDIEMTSMENELKKQISMQEVKKQIIISFKNIFNLEIRENGNEKY